MAKGRQAAIYTRISLDRTGESAGVQRQLRECMALAKRAGLEVVETYSDDDISAYSGKRRPGWDSLLKALDAGTVKVVLAWANDRLYRSTKAQLELMTAVQAAQGRIITVKDGEDDPSTAAGRMKMGILANVAEFESARKAERIQLWHEDRVARGLPHGGGRRPYGYEWDRRAGTWRIRESEAVIVRRMAQHLLSGRSLSSLVRALNLEGIPTANGGRWANGTVSKLLQNPTIAGLRHHKRTETTTTGNWPAIITPQQRELLIALFNDPTRPKRGGGPTNRTRLLSGLLVCGKCGSKMYGDGPNGYTCHKSWRGCGNVRIASAPLEDWVYWEAMEQLGKLKKAGRIVERAEASPDSDALLEERLRLTQRRDAFAEKLAQGLIDDRAYAVGVRALDKKISDLNQRVSAIVKDSPTLSDDDDSDVQIVVSPVVGRNWTALLSPAEVLQRHETLKVLIDRVVVEPASRRGVRWEPERLNIVWQI